MALFTSFFCFLLLTAIVGFSSIKQSKQSVDDYLLASRDISYIPMALSTAASKISGFMFIGMIGYIYQHGLSSLWLIVGWIFGDLVIWRYFYRPIRKESEKFNIKTITSFAFTDNNGKLLSNKLLIFLSVLILIFMTIYASAQISAGAKSLELVLNIDYKLNILLATVLIGIYCFAGGIRASIWTDTMQAIIMLIAMIILGVLAIHNLGSITVLLAALKNIDTNLVDLRPCVCDSVLII